MSKLIDNAMTDAESSSQTAVGPVIAQVVGRFTGLASITVEVESGAGWSSTYTTDHEGLVRIELPDGASYKAAFVGTSPSGVTISVVDTD